MILTRNCLVPRYDFRNLGLRPYHFVVDGEAFLSIVSFRSYYGFTTYGVLCNGEIIFSHFNPVLCADFLISVLNKYGWS